MPVPARTESFEVIHPAPTYGEPKQTVPTIRGTLKASETTDASDSVMSGCARTPLSLATNADPTVSCPDIRTRVDGTPSISEIKSQPGPG